MSLFKNNVSDLTHLICWIPFYIQVSFNTSLIPLWKLEECYYLLRRDRVKETTEKQVEDAFLVFSLVIH